ncbi:MAG TPA: purine-nucleoside phosphorylase [Actinobacteria bacterium]|nr:purine-nucleoside phosphorylase [Actinomycetota bacterium]
MDPVEQFREQIREATRFIRERRDINPKIGIVLGSGLGSLADDVEEGTVVPYGGIPHLPIPTVPGHPGNLIVGFLEGKKVVVLQGRFHCYEGYTMKGVTFPIRILKSLGVERLIITNSAGGLNPKLKIGELMLIIDHINLMGTNPLIGPNDPELGPRFLDMSEVYDEQLRDITLKVARKEKIELSEGVYAAVIGPTYETPAEVKFLSLIGADVVGMSTVPEVTEASHAGIKVLGISCITNMLSGRQRVSHEEVAKVAETASGKLKKLVRGVLREL